MSVGFTVGSCDGKPVGVDEGPNVGLVDGSMDGIAVGLNVGNKEGFEVVVG